MGPGKKIEKAEFFRRCSLITTESESLKSQKSQGELNVWRTKNQDGRHRVLCKYDFVNKSPTWACNTYFYRFVWLLNPFVTLMV